MATTSQNPSGPPVQACEILAVAVNTEAKILKAWKDILEGINKIKKMRWSILYGVLDIADIIGTEAFSAISITSSSITNAVLKGVSGAINSLLEAILSQILSILLAFPNSIFSLVAIPLERAIETANKERYYLLKARKNIQYINSIIRKWAANIDGSYYYKQMLTSMPYITRVLTLIQQMLSELSVNWQNENSSNAMFDQSKYRELKALLRQAISITQSSSILDTNAQFSKSIANALNIQRQNHIISIEKKYQERKKQLDTAFMNRLESANAKGNTVKEHLQVSLINLDWANQTKQMQAEKKAEISLAQADINYQQLLSTISMIHKDNIQDSFAADMNLLGNYLSEFLDNITAAYKQNLQCQNFCGTVYNIRTLIQRLVKYILNLLRQTGNVSSLIATEALEGAEALVATAQNLFQQKIKDYQDQTNAFKTSSAVMSVGLTSGNILLETADATMNSVITDSLIKLINSDDVLAANNKEFNAFLKRMEKIPDWNNQNGSWITNLVGGVTLNPYIQLIANATELVTMIPILAFSGKSKASSLLIGITNSVDKEFKKVLRHNSIVTTVINSYTPYQSSECGNLKKLLNQIGLLDAFADGLNFSTVVDSFIKMADLSPNYIEPNLINCRTYYPDLFNDVDAVAYAYESEANTMKPSVNISVVQSKHEKFNIFPSLAASSTEFVINADQTQEPTPTQSAFGLQPE
jgi:hypothetical protein